MHAKLLCRRARTWWQATGAGRRASPGFETKHQAADQRHRHRRCGGRRRGLTGNTLTISTARSEAAARPAGPVRGSRRRAELKARSADGERAGRPRGGRKSGAPGTPTAPQATQGTRHTQQPGPTMPRTPATPQAAPEEQAAPGTPAAPQAPQHISRNRSTSAGAAGTAEFTRPRGGRLRE